MLEFVMPSPPSPVPYKPVAVTALLLHAMVVSAAIGGTASAPVPVQPVRRDTIRLQMTEVPPAPRPWRPAPLPADLLPAPPRIDFQAPESRLPGPSFNLGDLPHPTGSLAKPTRKGLPVSLDSFRIASTSTAVDEPPELIGELEPQYPQGLRRAGVSGLVRVEYVVGLDGRMDPGSVRVLSSSHPEFVLAALQALREARFKAAQRRGRPISVMVQQAIRFTIR